MSLACIFLGTAYSVHQSPLDLCRKKKKNQNHPFLFSQHYIHYYPVHLIMLCIHIMYIYKNGNEAYFLITSSHYLHTYNGKCMYSTQVLFRHKLQCFEQTNNDKILHVMSHVSGSKFY